MRWNLIRFDETNNWSDDIRAQVKTIWGVYAYTPDEVTHTEPVTYMHCRTVDKVPIVDLKARTPEAVHVACGEFDEGPEHAREEYVREWWDGNPIW